MAGGRRLSDPELEALAQRIAALLTKKKRRRCRYCRRLHSNAIICEARADAEGIDLDALEEED